MLQCVSSCFYVSSWHLGYFIFLMISCSIFLSLPFLLLVSYFYIFYLQSIFIYFVHSYCISLHLVTWCLHLSNLLLYSGHQWAGIGSTGGSVLKRFGLGDATALCWCLGTMAFALSGYPSQPGGKNRLTRVCWEVSAENHGFDHEIRGVLAHPYQDLECDLRGILPVVWSTEAWHYWLPCMWISRKSRTLENIMWTSSTTSWNGLPLSAIGPHLVLDLFISCYSFWEFTVTVRR